MHGKKTPISIEDVAVNELDFMGEYFFRKDMPQTHFAWFQPRFSEVANWKSENWWIWSGQNWEFKHQKWGIEPSKLGIFHHHGDLTWFNEVMGMRQAEAKSLWCATSFVLCPVCWCKHLLLYTGTPTFEHLILTSKKRQLFWESKIAHVQTQAVCPPELRLWREIEDSTILKGKGGRRNALSVQNDADGGAT